MSADDVIAAVPAVAIVGFLVVMSALGFRAFIDGLGRKRTRSDFTYRP